MENTSKASWKELVCSTYLTKMQLECVSAFMELGGKATAHEVESHYQRKHNLMTRERVMGKRISELVYAGILRKVEEQLNLKTDRWVNVYELTGVSPDGPIKMPKPGTKTHHHSLDCLECLGLYMDGVAKGKADAESE